MATQSRVREFYPARMFNGELLGMPGLFAQTGADPAAGIPLGWLRQLAADMEAFVRGSGGTQEEVDSIRVFGAEALRASFTDALTPEEQMRDELRALRADRAAMLALFDVDGNLLPGSEERLLALLRR